MHRIWSAMNRYRLLISLLFFLCQFSNASELSTKNKTCTKTTYLTFDTGNMAVAQLVADVLKRNQIQATFFLSNEKTKRGDFALDTSWQSYWQERVREGHRFGSHTYDHVYWLADSGDDKVLMKPQFGKNAGKTVVYDANTLCAEIKRVDTRFQELTGRKLDPIWRASGGKISARLTAMGEQCGYRHVGWSSAGFLGDELDSNRHPNAVLFERASKNLKDGDIAMAHLGIWSRQDPWAPAVLEPLIQEWKRQGFCFAAIAQ